MWNWWVMKVQQLNGFIKIHRKLLQWGWYQDNVVKGVFLHLLLTSSFKDTHWMNTTIKKGELVTTNRRLSDELGFSIKQIRTALKKLESTGEIIIKGASKYTLITVVNWEEYQCRDYDDGNQRANKGQTKNGDLCEQIMNKIKNMKKRASKTASKEELETVVNSAFLEFEEVLRASKTANEGQTKGKQRANKGQHRKNNKECKEGKEETRARELTPLERELARRGVTMEHYLELKNQ